MVDSSVIPRVPPWLQPTPAALAALDADAPVVLVQAPPGYGKTGTVAAWLDRRPERLRVWADVPAGADGTEFLDEIGRELERTREFRQVVFDPSTPGEDHRLTLVVDRLDRLPEDVDARLLADALAAGAQLVVIARRSRSLRAFGGVRPSRVDEDRLRLNAEDVLALAARIDRRVQLEQAKELVAVTSGWPAAVLAAVREGRLPGAGDRAWQPGAILTGYAETILLDPEFLRFRELLLLFGIVESLTDQIVAATLDDAPALAEFSRSGPVRLEHDETGWRLPAVLRSALTDLHGRLDPAADRRLRTRLHHYHAARREWGPALQHAIASADPRLIGEFVAAHWPRLAVEARDSLAGAVPLLEPVAPLSRFLRRDVLDGGVRHRGGRDLLNGALLSPSSVPVPEPVGTPVVAVSRLVTDGEAPAPPGGDDSDNWRLRWAWTQFLEREHVAACEVFWRLTDHGDAVLRSEARIGLALCLVNLGFVHAARAWWAAVAADSELSPTGAAARWLVERLLRNEGQVIDGPEAPEVTAEQLEALAELSSESAALADYIGLRRQVHEGATTGGEAGLELSARAWSTARSSGPLVRASITRAYVEQLIALGRFNGARKVLTETGDVPGWDIALTARLDWLAGNFADVLRRTGASLSGAGLVDNATRLSPRLHGQLLVLDALAALRLGRRDRAMNTLDAALELTRYTGYWRAWQFVPGDDAARIVALLPTLSDVIARIEPGGHGPEPMRGMVHLSPRESDVLEQWAHDRTVTHIAGELFISANSVKSHLRSIYRKLGVNDRAGAIERARQLSLLRRSNHSQPGG